MKRIVNILILLLFASHLIAECSDEQFDCGDYCIPISFQCDGYPQCINGIDEQNCSNVDDSLIYCSSIGGYLQWVSDGYCDNINNNPECNWDGGDCCEDTCEDDDYQCGEFYQLDLNSDECWDNCFDPNSCGTGLPQCEALDFHVYPNPECGDNYTNSIIVSWNSVCDVDQLCYGLSPNELECYHLGYYSSPLILNGFGANSTYYFQLLTSQFGSSDVLPVTTILTDCMYENPYSDCDGYVHWIADGYCDEMNNNAGCGFDGGDCCECTCVDSEYECGIVGFECEDPSVDCDDEVMPEQGFNIEELEIGQRTDGSGMVDIEFEVLADSPEAQFVVEIEFSTDMGQTYFPIFETENLTAVVGFYSQEWQVPPLTFVDDIKAKVRLINAENTSNFIEKESPTFTVDTVPPEVQIQTPNGGEHIEPNDEFMVVWSAEDNSVIRYEMDVFVSTGLGEEFRLEVDDVEMQGMMNAVEVEIDLDDEENLTRYAKVNVNVYDLFGNEGFDESDDFFILGDPQGGCQADWFSEEEDMIVLEWGWRTGHLVALHRRAIMDLIDDEILMNGSRIIIKDQHAILDMDCNGQTGNGILSEFTFNGQIEHVGLKAYEGINHCATGGTRYPGYNVGDEIQIHIVNEDNTAYEIIPSPYQMNGPTEYTGGISVIKRLNYAEIEDIPIEDVILAVSITDPESRDYDSYNIYRSTNQTNLRNCTDDPNCYMHGSDCVCKIESAVTQTYYFDNYAAQSNLWCYNVWLLDNNIDQNEVLKTVDTCMNGGNEDSACTDPMAVNYNPSASTDDGSCYYASRIPIVNGWNWISPNVLNPDMSLNSVFSSVDTNIVYIKDQNSFSDYYSGYGWWGSLDSIKMTSMYKLNAVNVDTVAYLGTLVAPGDVKIPIQSGWNWISYPRLDTLDLNTALASIDGSGLYIKNQVSFSDYYELGGWWGTLNQFIPNDGYMLNAVSNDTLEYPIARSFRKSTDSLIEHKISDWSIDVHQFEFSGSIMASIDDNNISIHEDDNIIYMKDDEIRGISSPRQFPLNSAWVFPSMLYSNVENEEGILAYYYNYELKQLVKLDNEFYFSLNMHEGNAFEPIMFSMDSYLYNELPNRTELSNIFPNPFNPNTNISFMVSEKENIHIQIYDVRGRLIHTLLNSIKDVGEYTITWDASHHPTGIYFVQFITSSEKNTQKILLLK